MSGLELNKIVASILLAALIAMLSGFITDIIYEPELSSPRGYSVKVNEAAPGPGDAQPKPISFDVVTLMRNANAAAGEEIFKKCQSCHSSEKGGPNKIGPDLWNVVGGKKASHESYSYSTALKDKGGIWDYDSLFHMIHKPRDFAPGTKMTFIGLDKPEDIANVIAYLREKASDNPLPLPN